MLLPITFRDIAMLTESLRVVIPIAHRFVEGGGREKSLSFVERHFYSPAVVFETEVKGSGMGDL